MASFIRAVLSNFTVTFFVLGLVAAGIAVARQAPPLTRAFAYDALLRWFLFFSIGVSMFYNFVMHVFFGEIAARFIGWADSPFQAEVGLASLGFAAVGFLAFRGGFELHLAAIVGPACFLLGAGIGHVYQVVTAHNMAPGNAGVMLYSDFLLPVVGLVLLVLARRAGPPAPLRR